jgi:hypothetical protein
MHPKKIKTMMHHPPGTRMLFLTMMMFPETTFEIH